MVIIVSESSDSISSKVVDWLFYNKVKYKRYNCDKDFLTDIKTNFYELDIDKVTSAWFRRDALFNTDYLENSLKLSEIKHLQKEYKVLKQYFFNILEKKSKFVLGNRLKYNLNKLEVLKIAENCSLNVPESLITTSKAELYNFYRTHKKLITKCLSDPLIKISENKIGFTFTSKILESDFSNMEDSFFPSFFQKLILKKHDIRVFYINKEFYPMAIFSQKDKNTETDFRNYTNNRTVPYILSGLIKRKLIKLMNLLKLNTGSIDLIHGLNDKLYFLEVNPVGQFGQLSFDCNYYLEKKIANILSHES